MFRDIKPESIGFDINGKIMLSDFGLAKELKPSAQVGPDKYHATSAAGSIRYMAPEVYRSSTYGTPADAYSYSLVLCQMLHLICKPFQGLTSEEEHVWSVFREQQRPGLVDSWPRDIKNMIGACWDEVPQYRLDFSTICEKLERHFKSRGYDNFRVEDCR